MKKIARKNPFRVGDAVLHPSSQQRGIVKEVSADWIRVHVFGKTLPGGKPYVARYSFRKVALLATREQLFQRAMELKRQQEMAQTPVGRIATWIKNIWKKSTGPVRKE